MAEGRTHFNALKTTALAPIAIASVTTATAVNPGFFLSMRSPNRKSCQSVCMATSPESHSAKLHTLYHPPASLIRCASYT